MREGNGFELLTDGREFFARMLAAIDASGHYILAEFYLVESGRIADRFIDAFGRAAARGVRVRVLFDAIGAIGFKEADRARLREAGVDLVFFNVPRWRAFSRMLVRDHRKLLLVDGAKGFTGGIGIADVFSPEARPKNYWLDSLVEITGPVLDDWHRLFARTWLRSTHRELDVLPLPAAAAHPGARGRLPAGAGLGTQELGRSVIKRVRKARARVWIATAYFWPSNRLRRALRRAARRGVDVRLLVPGPLTDAPAARGVARLFYARLLSNGVVIYEYQPRFLHSKLVLCDDWASIGSSNLDRWGLLWNLEANQEIDSAVFAAQVEAMLLQTFGHSIMLRQPSDVKHHWSVPFWRLIAPGGPGMEHAGGLTAAPLRGALAAWGMTAGGVTASANFARCGPAQASNVRRFVDNIIMIIRFPCIPLPEERDMRFRLKALGLHLAASACALSLILGSLYLGWYRWPGWYLTDVVQVVLVMAGVDVVLGPLMTFIIARPTKPRRELARDIAVIVAVQLLALAYGSVSLWNGRPLYYAFSENVLQLVQAYDIDAEEWALGDRQNPMLAPYWYSLPRWIWAPLPQDPQERRKIVGAAITGGDDVISMPRYFKDWEQGLSALRGQLKKVDDVAYFAGSEKKRLKEIMRAAGIPTDRPNAMPLTGRGHPLLAVFDPAAARITSVLRVK